MFAISFVFGGSLQKLWSRARAPRCHHDPRVLSVTHAKPYPGCFSGYSFDGGRMIYRLTQGTTQVVVTCDRCGKVWDYMHYGAPAAKEVVPIP